MPALASRATTMQNCSTTKNTAHQPKPSAISAGRLPIITVGSTHQRWCGP